MSISVYKIDPLATTPTRAHNSDAGIDLYSNQTTIIPSKSRKLIETGIAIAIPDGCYGQITSRSGLATKHCIDIGASIVDSNYRGEIRVLLINSSNVDFKVEYGMKIAQLICQVIQTPTIKCVNNLIELGETERGSNGFGSSGM